MRRFDWDQAKNVKLRKERGVGFEDIKRAVDKHQLLDDFPHPNKGKYPNQRLMVVKINDYGYLVPYVESEGKLFLKTIIPSRKATKLYLRKEKV